MVRWYPEVRYASIKGMDPSSPSLAAIVRAHMDAVRGGDPAAMAAHYTADAVISRPNQQIKGTAAILEYFCGVPERLAGSQVRFDSADVHDAGRVTFHWHLEGGSADGVRGSDTVVLRDGLIAHQTVQLHSGDF